LVLDQTNELLEVVTHPVDFLELIHDLLEMTATLPGGTSFKEGGERLEDAGRSDSG
jgi:hypothetical protein